MHALTNHPDIQSATFGPAPNGLLDWDVITITFTDDTLRLLNVNVAHPTYPGETEAECVERVLKLVFNSEAATGVRESSLTDTLPLVRSADYFLECGPTTPVAVAWLTDFIGMGLGALRDDTLRIIDETQLPENHDEFDDLQLRSRALENLHAASEYLAVAEFGLGPNIVGVTRPMDNESAWFADVQEMEMAMRQLSEDTNSMWVAIPAHASRFLNF